MSSKILSIYLHQMFWHRLVERWHIWSFQCRSLMSATFFFCFPPQLPLLLLLLQHWFAVTFMALVLMEPLWFVSFELHHTFSFSLSHTLDDTLRHAPSLLLAAPFSPSGAVMEPLLPFPFVSSPGPFCRGVLLPTGFLLLLLKLLTLQTWHFIVCSPQLGFSWNGSHFWLHKRSLSVLKFTLCKPEPIPLYLKFMCFG